MCVHVSALFDKGSADVDREESMNARTGTEFTECVKGQLLGVGPCDWGSHKYTTHAHMGILWPSAHRGSKAS